MGLKDFNLQIVYRVLDFEKKITLLQRNLHKYCHTRESNFKQLYKVTYELIPLYLNSP